MLLELLLLLIVLGVVFYVVRLAATAFGAPEWLIQAVGILCLLIFILAVFRALGVTPYGWRGGGL